MADDTVDQRLAQIEATLATLATKADVETLRSEFRTHFEGVDGEFNQLSEKIGAALRSTDTLRSTYTLQYQMLQLQLQQLGTVPGLLDRVIVVLEEIVRRITDRDNPAPEV